MLAVPLLLVLVTLCTLTLTLNTLNSFRQTSCDDKLSRMFDNRAECMYQDSNDFMRKYFKSLDNHQHLSYMCFCYHCYVLM